MDTSDTAATVDTDKAMTLRLPLDLHDRIRLAAAHERKPMSQWIREALELVVERTEARRA